MTKVLIVAEYFEGKLNAATAKCVSAAQALQPDSIDIVVLGEDPASAAAEAARITGVTKVLTVANVANSPPIAQVLAPQVSQLASGYSHVFGPSTTFGKDLMPCVAALLGVSQVSDLMAVVDSHTFKRPIYAGNAIVTVEASAADVVVATVRTASWPEAARDGSATVEAVKVETALPTHTRFVGLTAGKSDRPDLQSARRVVSGGRGVGSKENFKIIFDFADRLAVTAHDLPPLLDQVPGNRVGHQTAWPPTYQTGPCVATGLESESERKTWKWPLMPSASRRWRQRSVISAEAP